MKIEMLLNPTGSFYFIKVQTTLKPAPAVEMTQPNGRSTVSQSTKMQHNIAVECVS